MTKKELNKILEEHEKWLRSFEREGKKADLYRADLRGADLCDANLSEADLRGADLRGADLYRADLREADLSNADLREADLSNAGLRGADLRGADLYRADLYRADLRGADLRDTDLSVVDLYRADLSGAKLPEPVIQVGPIGSHSGYTVFYVGSGIVKCGCWHGKNREIYQGGTLEEFKQRIDEVYPASSKDECKLRYRKEYLAAIAMFEAM